MLPCRVRVSTLPLPKSMWISGTGRTLTQTGSKFLLTKVATSGRENNTVLASLAFVQQNSSSSLPVIWNRRTGLPVFTAAARASSTVLCQTTLPGSTLGLTKLAGVSLFAGLLAGVRASGPGPLSTRPGDETTPVFTMSVLPVGLELVASTSLTGASMPRNSGAATTGGAGGAAGAAGGRAAIGAMYLPMSSFAAGGGCGMAGPFPLSRAAAAGGATGGGPNPGWAPWKPPTFGGMAEPLPTSRRAAAGGG